MEYEVPNTNYLELANQQAKRKIRLRENTEYRIPERSFEQRRFMMRNPRTGK